MNALQIINSSSTRRYSTLSAAQAAADRFIDSGKYSIIMGCDMRFWVVTNREASILVKGGYEIAPRW